MAERDDTMIFCENIKRIREENHLSHAEMGKRLRVGKDTVITLESGVIPSRLSCAILFRIQEEFGIHPKDMFAPMDK
jgi:transcriptional regulator with XRE-family HTH domain